MKYLKPYNEKFNLLKRFFGKSMDEIIIFILNDNIAQIKKLIRYRINLDITDEAGTPLGEAGNTPLIWAVSYDKIKIVKLLIDYGVNLDTQNNIGNTALIFSKPKDDDHRLSLCCQIINFQIRMDVIRLLLDAGADEGITNYKGKTFYDYLSSKGLEIINKEYPQIGYTLSGYPGLFKDFLLQKSP